MAGGAVRGRRRRPPLRRKASLGISASALAGRRPELSGATGQKDCSHTHVLGRGTADSPPARRAVEELRALAATGAANARAARESVWVRLIRRAMGVRYWRSSEGRARAIEPDHGSVLTDIRCDLLRTA